MTKKYNTQKEKFEAIIDSIISIILGLVVILSIFVFILPNINNYFKLKKKINEQELLVQKLKGKIENMNSYSTQELDNLYQESLKYLPENINIGDMGNTINQIAKQFNLKIERLSLAEATQNRPIKIKGQKKELITLPLKSITAPFLMTGQKQDLLSFLDLLTGSLEAREFNTIQLIETKENVWSLRLTLTHLYMPYIYEIPISADLPNINKGFIKVLNNQENQTQNSELNNNENIQTGAENTTTNQ